MTLIAPAWLLLGTLGIVVLALHLRERRTFAIPSIQLWRLIESGTSSRRPIRLPSPSLLLLLQLLIVGLTALALARPIFGSSTHFAHEVVVLDASGSMRSLDIAPSRFDAAVSRLAAMAAGPIRESGARVSLLVAGARPQIIAARLADPNGLSLEGLQAGDGDADWAAVIRLLWSVLKEGEPTRLTLITNQADASRLSAAFPGVAVETLIVGGATPRNAALHATLRAVDASSGKWQAEGSVVFSPGFLGPVTVTALVQPDGSDGFLQWRSVDVAPPAGAAGAAPGRSTVATFALDLDLRVPSAVTLRLPEDAGPQDNSVHFIVRPKPRALKILQLGDVSEPLTRALKAAADVELFAADVLPADIAAFDLIVVNGIEIARRPATNVLWLGAAHVSSEPGGQRHEVTQPTLWQSDHPLSRSISWSTVTTGAAYGLPRLQGAETIVEAGGAPLIQARITLTGREVRVGFDVGSSNWPDQPSFPIFVSNLLRWIAPDLGRSVEPACIVGTSCVLDPRLLGGDVVLARPDPADLPLTIGAPARILPAVSRADFLPRGYDAQFIPDRAGIYRLERGGVIRLVAVNTTESAAMLTPEGSVPAAAARASDHVPLRWGLLVAVFALLLAEGWLAGRGSERFLRPAALAHGNPLASRRRLLFAARLGALTFVGCAIAGVPLPVLDRSQNVAMVARPNLGPGGNEAELLDRIAAVADRDRANGGDPRIGIVAMDANSRIAADLGAVSDHDRVGEPPGTPAAADLENALAVAAGMLPTNEPGRIVVTFDGNETRGNAALVMPTIVRRGVKIDVLPQTRLTAGEVLVEKVAAPERVYAGDTFPLQALIYSHGPSHATARVLKDGDVIAERPLELAGGRSRIETIVPAARTGRVRYEVEISAPGDTFAQNNRDGVIVDVAPSPRVLIVAAQPAWAEVFAKALAVQDIETRIVEPKRAPFYLKDWLAYSAIVLMNVPAIDLATLQQELIEKAVAEHGRGLLLLGGENSFGPGGYYETPLERVSPLSSRVPRDAPRVALAFVLDRSGSMQRNEGGATRLDIAKQATVSAIGLLHPESLIAVVVFDSEAKVLLPLRPAKDSAGITQALQALEPGGGTAIYPGLVEALHQLQGVDAAAKHIVVMSDGLTQPGDFPGILKAISEQGISVSTVAIGDGADPVSLEGIARIGKGAFHATQDFKALPSILSQEALLLSGKPVEERPAAPSWAARNGEFFAGLPDKLPPLAGYVLTTRKPLADLHVVVHDERQEPIPLLASWRYGSGRVVALATHGAGAWTKDWQAMAEYPLLWSQTLRHIFPGQDEGLFSRFTRQGDEVEIEMNALSREGVPREGLKMTASLAGPATGEPLTLSEMSPGRYHGSFMLDQPGEFTVRAVADQTAAEAPLLVSYPALYDFTRADPDRLLALAAATGGRVLESEQQIFTGGEPRWVARALWQVWVLAALILFLADLTVRYGSRLVGARVTKRDTLRAG